jgi:hypothetical protein
MNLVKNSLSALLLFLLLPVANVLGQIETEKRIEFELREGYEAYELAQFRENGLLVYCHEEKSVAGNLTWKVDHYSTDLDVIDSKEFTISDDYRLNKSKEDGIYLYLFFVSKRKEYLLTRINSQTLEMKQVYGELPKKSYAGTIAVIDDNVFVDCISKTIKTLKIINVESGGDQDVELKVEGFKPTMISVENFQVDEDSKELYVFMNARFKKTYQLYVLRFDETGKLQEEFNLTEDSPMTFSSISGSFLAEGEYMFTGTFSEKSASSSEGIFICKTTNGKKDFLKFYKFLEFEEFLNYLPQKQQDKIERKKGRKEARGKELKLSYLMASHNVRYMDGKYIYIGEAYYPTYRTETRTTFVNGVATTTTYQVFDGFYYTHATIAAFDLEGEKLWDKTFEMRPGYKPFSPIRFIRVTETNPTELGLMFTSYGSLKSKAINTDGEVINDRTLDMIETGNEDDKVKFTFSNLTFWYDNYFLAHGNQTIKNLEEKEERGKRKRRVYFINKISYSF